ncbi:hypothetical protein [uncultured Cohaesibacter sp.]|uniref:hypothetical protein n=1 Tax=uncultured Cohaesibacter sp. TaxID=1002546 RepID=UPI00292D1073|nr:hypothetical protein [uncultured Cohaesibacter sp.]
MSSAETASRALQTRILSKLLPKHADAISMAASQEGLDIEVRHQINGDDGQIEISGADLLSRHFGSRESEPGGLISRLLASLSEQRRQL